MTTKKAAYISLLFCLFLLSSRMTLAFDAQPPDLSLTPDTPIRGAELIEFPNDDRIYPDISDFEIIHHIIMSNDIGERWATVTFKNTSSGRRTLQPSYVLALFTNGQRLSPKNFKYPFEGGEVRSLTLNFGNNKFPILRIYTRN